jgi:hypothetical protein
MSGVKTMPPYSPWAVTDLEFPTQGSIDRKARFLLRYAILAPSKHNVQPWTFRVDDDTIGIRANVEQWQVSEGAELRELYLSLGCALENLAIAAEYFGLLTVVEPRPSRPDHVVDVVLKPGSDRWPRPHLTELFSAITRRHTARTPFGERPIFATKRERLEHLTLEPGCRLLVTGDIETKRAVERIAGDAVLVHRPRATTSWPDWGDASVPGESTSVVSAPLIAIVSATTDDAIAQIRAGQAFERLFLTTTSLSLDLRPMSVVLQRPELRARVAELLPEAALFPQVVCRIGSPGSEEWEHTPRRSLLDVG